MRIHADLVSTWNQISVRISGLKCQIRIKSFNYIHKMPLVIMWILITTNFYKPFIRGFRLSRTAAEMELPILVYTRPWDGRKSRVKSWDDGRITHLRPIVWRNDVVTHRFRSRVWANASKQIGIIHNLNFTIDPKLKRLISDV